MVGEPQSEQSGSPRGDRAARRREVLAAAAAVLEEQDWQDFSIRDVAGRVGVSPGAVYLWFSGKDDILAHLQAARLRSDAAAVRVMPDDQTPELFAVQITEMLTRMYAEVGRHPVALDAAPDGQNGTGVGELLHALEFAIETIQTKLQTVLSRSGATHRDLGARLAWLWASARGIAGDVVAGRHRLHGIEPDDFVRTATERTAAGLLGTDLLRS